MKFLSKLGQIVLKGTSILTGISLFPVLPPKVQAIEQAVVGELQQLAGVITTVEAVGQALGIAGPDKLKAAAPLIAQAILQSSLMAHHEIANAALFTQGCSKIGDGLADVLNSLKESGVSETSKT